MVVEDVLLLSEVEEEDPEDAVEDDVPNRLVTAELPLRLEIEEDILVPLQIDNHSQLTVIPCLYFCQY